MFLTVPDGRAQNNNLEDGLQKTNSGQLFQALTYLEVCFQSIPWGGSSARTLGWFCHLNELIYSPVTGHLFTVVKTSLICAVSLHPALLSPQYPCKHTQRLARYTTYETFSPQ